MIDGRQGDTRRAHRRDEVVGGLNLTRECDEEVEVGDVVEKEGKDREKAIRYCEVKVTLVAIGEHLLHVPMCRSAVSDSSNLFTQS